MGLFARLILQLTPNELSLKNNSQDKSHHVYRKNKRKNNATGHQAY